MYIPNPRLISGTVVDIGFANGLGNSQGPEFRRGGLNTP